MAEHNSLIHFNEFSKSRYLNFIKKNKEVALISRDNEAKLASFILADINLNNINNYLNVSVRNNVVGDDAPEAKLASHLSHKQGLSGHPGSIPGWGAPPAFFSKLIKSKGIRMNSKILKVQMGNQESFLRKSFNSFVVKILISDCCLKAFSSDQIGHLSNARDDAKYGLSLVCGDNSDDLGRNFLNLFSESNLISSSIMRSVISNSPREILENCIILSFSALNSFRIKYGDISSEPLFNISSTNCLLVESFLKNEKRILASTTNVEGNEGIFYQPCFLAALFLVLEDKVVICSSVNSDLDIISSTIENLNLLTNCSTTFSSADSNLPDNSGGTSNLILISSINRFTQENYLNFSSIPNIFQIFEKLKLLNTSIFNQNNKEEVLNNILHN